MLGSDAREISAASPVTVQGARAASVKYVTVQPDQVIFRPGDTLDVTGKNPWITNDTDSAFEQPHAAADNIVEAVNNDQSFVNLASANVRYAPAIPTWRG